VRNALLRFDLTSLPTGAQVVTASLELHPISQSVEVPVAVDVFGVLQHWEEDEATWNLRFAGLQWGNAGCRQPGVDRREALTDRKRLIWMDRPLSVDVTHLVQAWLDEPAENHGLLLRAASRTSVELTFSSAEALDPALHPRLSIRYALPAGDPTPSPTPEETATPTWTVTGTPPTATPTGTATPTPTITPTPGPPPTVVAFQQGVEGYHGAQDATINRWEPNTNYHTAPALSLRTNVADNDMEALLRFDVGEIPPQAQVVQATLSLYVSYRSNANWLWAQAHQVLRPWEAAQVTWNQAGLGDSWAVPGCNGLSTDRADSITDRAFMFGAGQWHDLNLTDLVQLWVVNPGQNQGILLRSYSSGSVQYDLASSEAKNPIHRPRLTVYYRLLPTPTPTWTGTPPTATPTATASATTTATATRTPSATPSTTPSPTASATASATTTTTATPSPSPIPTKTLTPTSTATATDPWVMEVRLHLPMLWQGWGGAPTVTPTPSPTSTPTTIPTVTITPTPRTPRLFTSQHVEGLTMDGDLSDWPASTPLLLDATTAETVLGLIPAWDDAHALVRSAWDETTLYFAFQIFDDQIVSDSRVLENDDGVELGLDGLGDSLPGGDDDHHVRVTADGRTLDGEAPAPWLAAAVQAVPGGYQVEMAIPAAQLGWDVLQAGDWLRFNLALQDDDDGELVDSTLIWEGNCTGCSSPAYGYLWLTN